SGISVFLLQHLMDLIRRIGGLSVDARELGFKNRRTMLQHLLALFKGIYAHEDNIAFPVFGNIDRLLTLMCKLRDRIIVISKDGRGLDFHCNHLEELCYYYMIILPYLQ